MIKILFVCHGNICRSPMAEFVMKDLVKKAGLETKFLINSAATSTEEIGNGIHYGTRQVLNKNHIPFTQHHAVQITNDDYCKYDYIIVMDANNNRNIHYIIRNDEKDKIHLLLEYAGLTRDVADPWYTGDFEKTYQDITLGCKALLKNILKQAKAEE